MANYPIVAIRNTSYPISPNSYPFILSRLSWLVDKKIRIDLILDDLEMEKYKVCEMITVLKDALETSTLKEPVEVQALLDELEQYVLKDDLGVQVIGCN